MSAYPLNLVFSAFLKLVLRQVLETGYEIGFETGFETAVWLILLLWVKWGKWE